MARLVTRRTMIATLAAAGPVLGTSAQPAHAQWQPAKPVQFIVMAGKGGGADLAVRSLITMIGKNNLASVPFEVLNMPGKSGGEAMAHMQTLAGDDHTLLFTLNSFYTAPIDLPELKLDIAAFTPIARLGEDVFLLWVHRDRTDIASIEDFVKAAKAKGKEWVMAGTGRGSEDQLLTEFLNATYNLQMTYKSFGGGGEVARELAEKRADSTVNNPSEQDEFYPKGITKPLVAFTPARLSAYAAVPPLRETGMDFHYYMQRSVVGAPRMSAEARSFWQQLFRRIFDSAEWKAYRQKNSLRGDFLTGQALMSYWLAERDKHARWKIAIELMRPR
jgi:tripartite-type tricarboxylate transporter receptor subunit TctC